MKLLYCTLLALVALATAKVDYSGHMVIRAIPETKEQLEFLRHLEVSSSIDIWSLPSRENEFADIHVSPETYYHIARSLSEMKMDHKIIISDLAELELQEQQAIALRRALFNGKAYDFENYHTYDEVMAFLEDLAATNPLVTLKVGGVTGQGRNIVQVTIGSGGAADKPVIFFDCNIHAREWITAATCSWIVDQLANGYGSDAEITALVDQYDWKFVPISNPDGYNHTWTTDRLWRKNRATNEGSPCIGVDPNRNMAAGWGGTDGASPLPCSETFFGTAAFSEKESSALRDLIMADRGRVKVAISVHSYSQLWLSPYGYKSTLPANYAEMLRVMRIACNALTATYGTQYTFGNTAATIYIASGVTTDHYFENENVFHSYTIEVRDTGRYGFELPPNQILPTATETWNGIKALVNAI